MARSLNKVQLIGNLTRDPELRYTPNGTAVCSFGLATNRSWKTETGEKREEAEFHNIVAWNKLAEICSQFLVKGRKVYAEGRIATRSWSGQDGVQRTRTEIIISDMILLDSRREGTRLEPEPKEDLPAQAQEPQVPKTNAKKTKASENKQVSDASNGEGGKGKSPKESTEEVAPDDIPF